MTPRLRLLAAPVAAALTLAGCSVGGTGTPSGSTTEHTSAASSCTSGKAPSFGGRPSAFDAPVPVDSASALSTQVSEPTLSTTTAPAAGLRIAEVKVNARVLTNGVFAVHPESFVLADSSGAVCPQPAKNPLKGALQVSQVDESHSATGTLAFVVPAEANLSNYTVYYLASPGAPKAVAAWSGQGTAPSVETATTCSTNRSGIKLTGAKDQPFEKSYTSGDDTISLSITPSKPWPRILRPGQNQPNDVSGVVVSLYVAAKGSVGYIERNQFQLLDDKGNLCRYNELGSDGETLSSDLVETSKPRRFDIVFWVPKGAEVAGWKLLYMPEPTDKKVAASWTLDPAENAPSTSPGGSPASASTTSAAPSSAS